MSLGRPTGSAVVDVHRSWANAASWPHSLYDRVYRPSAPAGQRIFTLVATKSGCSRASIVKMDDASLKRERNRFGAIGDAQLLQNVLEVHLHRTLRPADDA